MKVFNPAAPHVVDSYDNKIIWPFGPCLYQSIITDEFKNSLLDEGRIVRDNNQDFRENLAGNMYHGGSYYYGEEFCKEAEPIFKNLALQWLDYMKDNFGIKTIDFTPGLKYIAGRPGHLAGRTTEDICLESLWINFHKKFDHNPPHSHDGIMSFVVYLQVPEEIFENQVESNTQQAGEILFYYGDSITPLSHCQYSIKPFDNLVLLFPASLSHAVYPFWIDVERISVSGNIGLRI